jgi:hypothetical protein
MNEMRKLMEAVRQLDETPVSPLEFFANEVSEYCGEPIGPEDLEVYSDGMSYAILCKATDEQFLYSDNIYGEGELEPAEFNSWPPKVHGHYGTALTKVTEERIDEYLLQTGMTLGEVFDAVLGSLDADKRGTEEFEPHYLESLGFMDAASTMEDMVDDVTELKNEMQPHWNETVDNDELLDELLGVAYHLEASSEYNDEEDYLETIVPSYEKTIEFLLNNYDIMVDAEAGESDFGSFRF